ncbi:MAG: FKBP-type peptidyl-prolyl cis-trans isomerase [Burkholderiaceae bacterium]
MQSPPTSNHSPNVHVKGDSHVTFHYRLSDPEIGRVYLSTFEASPATLQLGAGQFAPGLERCLLALQEGETRSYDLGPDDAFGPRNPDLLQLVARQLIEAHADPADQLEPGDLLGFPTPDGGRFAGVFKGWEGDGALFDFNHPLAGQPLRFEVQMIGVL